MDLTFQEFESALRAQGYEEVIEREWSPLTFVDAHTHPFAAKALVVRGEMWLTVGVRTQHLLPGGTFELAAEEVHTERYGIDGATYWVGRVSPRP
jgi:hypothetical protein